MLKNINIIFLLLLLSISSISFLRVNNKSNKKERERNIFLFSRYIIIPQFSKNFDKKYNIASNIKCSQEKNCPASTAKCISGNECKCNPGYLNQIYEDVQVPNFQGNYCSYEQKKQIISFILEGLLSFGLGHIYAERFFIGYAKFTLCFAILCLYLLQYFISRASSISEPGYTKSSPCLLILSVFLCMILGMWQLVDILVIGLNKYLDGNSMPMQDMI